MKLKPRDIKKYNKLANKKPIMARVGSKWYTWAEGDPKHGVFLTTQSGRDVEFDFNQIDDIQENSVNEAKREIGGYYLMKQLKDLAHDAKRNRETAVYKALMYLHDRINQSYRDIDLNVRDVQDIFNDPRGRKYSKDMPDWMIDSLFEGKVNERSSALTIRKKLLKKFGKDPLYREFILAKTPKEQKKAVAILKSIRGPNAIRLMQKYAISLRR